MTRPCLLLEMGLVEYGEAFRFQRALATARDADLLPDLLITLEHTPVLTLGRRASQANVLASHEWLQSQGIAVHQSSRGGDVTYHGPGQLVGYPILDLRRLRLGAAEYVHTLERIIVEVLGGFGLAAHQDPEYVGVWVGAEKVAAIGVAISRGITLHGFAVNVDPNLAHFGFINPCGITDRGVASVAKLLGRPVGLEEIRPQLVEGFARAFGMDMVVCDLSDLESRGIPLPQTVSRIGRHEGECNDCADPR